ncbi:hypothetical protein Tco_1025957 [Tanacetum coccineum]
MILQSSFDRSKVMALPNLTPITKLATYKSTKTNRNPVVQVKRIEKTERHKYKLQLSDGSDFHDAYVDSTLKKSKVIKILDLDVIPNIMALDLTLRPIRELKTDKSTRTNVGIRI